MALETVYHACRKTGEFGDGQVEILGVINATSQKEAETIALNKYPNHEYVKPYTFDRIKLNEQKVIEIARSIAYLLPKTWVATDANCRPGQTLIFCTTDHNQGFTLTWDRKDRLIIRGNYPVFEGPKERIYLETELSRPYRQPRWDIPIITVAMKRHPQDIANDIKNRFLPQYEELYSACLTEYDVLLRYYNNLELQISECQDTLSRAGRARIDKHNHNHIHFSIGEFIGEIRVTSDSIEFIRTYFPLSLGKKILQEIANHYQKEQNHEGRKR